MFTVHEAVAGLVKELIAPLNPQIPSQFTAETIISYEMFMHFGIVG